MAWILHGGVNGRMIKVLAGGVHATQQKELNMKAKLTTFILLATLILTACGSKAPTETVAPVVTDTPAAVATNTPATESTSTTEASVASTELTATVTDQPTATSEPRPTNVAGCTNSAAFVADITIPDNTQDLAHRK